LRNNGILKIVSVAAVWSGLIVLIPQMVYQNNLKYEWILKSLFVFIYILMLTMSFDQRDLLIDKQSLKTLPQRFSAGLKYIYLIFLLILLILSFYIFKDKELIISILTIILSVILCSYSHEKKSFYYTAFWIEAIPVFWYLTLNYI
jgi:L-asparagine transporter-like permease